MTEGRPAPNAPLAGPHGGRLHVLVSAYSCEPERGSEPGIGWNTVVELSRHARLTVLARTINRPALERGARHAALGDTRFIYLDLPAPVRLSQRGTRGLYWYYIVWQWLAWRRARREHRRDPFDVVYHATFCSLHMPVWLHWLPAPFVFGPLAGGEMSSPAFWRGGGRLAWLYEAMRALRMQTTRVDPLVQLALRRSRRLLVATPETRRYLPARRQDAACLLHTTAVEGELTQRALPRRDGARIVTAGRLVHWKGAHLGIQAFARARRQHPRATLTIVGDGPQRARLEALVTRLGLDGQVTFVGERTRAETLELLAASDVLLFPSLHDSGAATILEAMALGLPVICLDAGGARVSVDDASGIRVPVTTPERVIAELAAALEQLLADDERRVAMGVAARRRVEALYTWDRRSAMLLDLLSSAARAGW
jgi:glycosyltransferase involved in cell wall biosynthesis